MTTPADEFVVEEPRGLLSRAELVGDLRPTLWAAALTVLAGVALGVLWAAIAPGRTVVTTAAGATASLAAESLLVFDATALFFLLATAFGVVAGGLAWRRRSRRGPVALVGVTVAATLGAWIAAHVGSLLTGPFTDTTGTNVLLDAAEASGTGAPGDPIPAVATTLPATLGSFWTVVGAGVGAVLAYMLCAIALGEEDLDRPDPEPEPDPATEPA